MRLAISYSFFLKINEIMAAAIKATTKGVYPGVSADLNNIAGNAIKENTPKINPVFHKKFIHISIVRKGKHSHSSLEQEKIKNAQEPSEKSSRH